MPAQSAPVILPDIEHPTSVNGAHLLRMVVRRNRAQFIGKLGMRLEEGQCFCRMVDKGSSEIAGRCIADDIVKVAQDLFATVDFTPAPRDWAESGRYIAAPESAVVPPKQRSFSKMMTSRPLTRAAIAAASAAAPEPTMTTSVLAGRPGSFVI